MRSVMDNAPGAMSREQFGFVLAALPALAVVSTGFYGLVVGAGVLFALIGTSLLLSAVWKAIRPGTRAFAYVLFAATLSSMADMILAILAPRFAVPLGFYIPLVAMSCALIGFSETTDEVRKPVKSALNALSRGAAYLAFLTLIGALREVLGAGAFFGLPLGDAFQPMRLIALAPGGFILAGVVLAVCRRIAPKRAKGGEGA